MPPPIVFMFSGQGSHYYQMGKGLFEAKLVFRQWMEQADQVVREATGRSFLTELYDPARSKGDRFDRIEVTHPALFAVQYAMFQVLRSEGVEPDLLLGSSLGELVAATAAGAVDFAEALRLLCAQARQLEASCPRSGGMIAILAAPELFSKESEVFRDVTLAGVNFDQHFVVSADEVRLAAVEAWLRQRDVTHQRLALTHAFHSARIESIAGTYRSVLEGLRLAAPQRPLIFCSTAGPVHRVDADTLWASVRGPIRFRETIQGLEQAGPHCYVDAGPAGTLATLAKYNLRPGSGSKALATLTPYGQDRDSLNAVRGLQAASAPGQGALTGTRL